MFRLEAAVADRPRQPDESWSPETGSSQLVPRAVSQRLSLYLRQLQTLERQGQLTVSSRDLARALGLTAAQVRKDLAYFGPFGQRGVGYRVAALVAKIRRILGTDRCWRVVLVGVGHLGQALIRYKGFKNQGFEIVCLLDADPRLTGRRYERLEVRPIGELVSVVQDHRAEIAVVAVPAEAAQSVVDRLLAAGVRGILNFAPVALRVPPQVSLVAVDLSIQLEQISHQLAATLQPLEREA